MVSWTYWNPVLTHKVRSQLMTWRKIGHMFRCISLHCPLLWNQWVHSLPGEKGMEQRQAPPPFSLNSPNRGKSLKGSQGGGRWREERGQARCISWVPTAGEGAQGTQRRWQVSSAVGCARANPRVKANHGLLKSCHGFIAPIQPRVSKGKSHTLFNKTVILRNDFLKRYVMFQRKLIGAGTDMRILFNPWVQNISLALAG